VRVRNDKGSATHRVATRCFQRENIKREKRRISPRIIGPCSREYGFVSHPEKKRSMSVTPKTRARRREEGGLKMKSRRVKAASRLILTERERGRISLCHSQKESSPPRKRMISSPRGMLMRNSIGESRSCVIELSD